ncbi:MAG TPA: CbiX/SirB N-terminal domain-containing protein [Nitrospiraceae bacterium]|nr:CbiX/SirB N-terminal domain-containing protein [Nitrospiraceae bacterium]
MVDQNGQQGVILVGHGGVPRDFPRDLLTRLKSLEAKRRATGSEQTDEEIELETRIRRWPRTPATDPYKAGLEALAAHLKPALNGPVFAIAYNEFCAPTVEEAVEDLIRRGATLITVVPSMLTPGGSHSEIEIPESLERLHIQHPTIELRYAWPFDLTQVAAMLAAQLRRF